MAIAGDSPFLFPSDLNQSGHQTTFKTVWHKTLRRAKVPYFRIYDLRATYATRLSAGGVADEWVTQMLRQGDAQVFKKYSQMKLQMLWKSSTAARAKCCRRVVNQLARSRCSERIWYGFWHGRGRKSSIGVVVKLESALESIVLIMSGRSAAW
jgi:hypothetical protein